MPVEFLERLSPNFNERENGTNVSMLVIHYTGMETESEALQRLCSSQSQVSAHYTISESGQIYQHVPETHRAWHAGVAHWRGLDDINSASIGIELVNPGHDFGYRVFPDVQMESLIALGRDISRRYNLLACNIVGHSDVAPSRKKDPGELFDWARMSRAGLGMWPKPGFRSSMSETQVGIQSSTELITDLQMALQSIGYGICIDGKYGEETEAVVKAFQRHFWQGGVTGQADPATIGLIGHVAGLVAVELFQSGQ